MKRYLKILSISLVLLSHLLLLSCAGTQGQKENDRREGEIHMQMGSNYLNKGNVELALFELTKASRLIPRNPEVHFALGTVHLLREEPDLAVEEFNKTVDINRKHADAYNNLGYAYLKLGDYFRVTRWRKIPAEASQPRGSPLHRQQK